MEREQTTIRLPVETKRRICEESSKRDISFNEMLNTLINDGLKRLNQNQS